MKKVFSVENYGAKSQKDFDSTKAIQNALDDCFFQGGGIVEIPKGCYNISSIRLRSNTTLHLLKDAVLSASLNPLDYNILNDDKIEPISEEEKTDVKWNYVSKRENNYHLQKLGSSWNNAVIRVIHAENVSIIGEEGSLISGNDCFDSTGEEFYRGPHGINCWNTTNLMLCGYSVKYSGNWAHCINDCENITVDGVKVYGGHDGIHFTGCRNTSIKNCELYTGDDCIAGFANLNVSVDNCVLNSSCSALRFGGTNVLVNNCKIYGPGEYKFRGILSKEEKASRKDSKNTDKIDTTLSVFTYYADKSHKISYEPGNIIISNCSITDFTKLIHYNLSGNEPWQTGTPLGDISFENITAIGMKKPSVLYGDKDKKTEITLKNCSFDFSPDFKGDSCFLLCNYKSFNFENVKIKNSPPDFICRWSNDGNIDLSSVESDVKTVKEADTDFFVDWV